MRFFRKKPEASMPESYAEEQYRQAKKEKAEADKTFHDIKGIVSPYAFDIIVNSIVSPDRRKTVR